MTLCHVKFSTSTEIYMEKCHTLMCANPRPSVTLLCVSTNDQASLCYVEPPIIIFGRYNWELFSEKKFASIKVIKEIVDAVKQSSHLLLNHLLAQLRTNIQLPTCLRIIGNG